MPDDFELQDRRRAYVAQVITGLNALEARQAQHERNQTRTDTRPQMA